MAQEVRRAVHSAKEIQHERFHAATASANPTIALKEEVVAIGGSPIYPPFQNSGNREANHHARDSNPLRFPK
jgi:hypothetical protein